jgi:hypothetical protein
MSFRDDLIGILSGGLPSLIELPTPQPANPQPEATPPSAGIRDREPFSLANVSQSQILLVTAGIIGLLGVIFVVSRR